MAPYILLLAIPAVAALFPRSLRSREAAIALGSFGLVIAAFVGLRHEVGGDWIAYEASFWRHGAAPFAELVDGLRDPGYYWSGWFLFRMGLPVHALNLLCAAILSWGLVMFCSRLRTPWLGMVAAIPYLVIVVGMGYTRQGAAIGFVLAGLAGLLNGEVRKYVFYVILATLMHRTALVLLPLAVIASTQNRIVLAVAIGAATVLLGQLLLASDVERMWGSYVSSSLAGEADGAPIRVAMNATCGLFWLVAGRRVPLNGISRRFWFAISLLTVVCVPVLAVSLTAVDRLALYLLPIQIFVIGNALGMTDSKFIRTGMALGIIGAYLLVLVVWMVFAQHSEAWLPYQSVFSAHNGW